MDRLCDEVLQITLNELDDPTPLTLLSKRFYQFTQDPYVRSSYFLSRYGRIQALFWALGRGRLLNEKVLDIMLSSGAHLSRYLAQCAMQHYFRAQVSFIKTRWVRTIPLPVFTHFLSIAARTYGDIPVGKGDDDGSLFSIFLKSSRYPAEYRIAKWDLLREALEKYKFIPFYHKDPMMAQFPLVLAIEPRLLPYARVNGFHMDSKYRNFVFRKMFERPAMHIDGRVDEIVKNVRELSRLDSHMFLSRTVAAEICMEARQNESAYEALKRLDKEGVLRFQLSHVVEELIKLFEDTRSITDTSTRQLLNKLHSDFPSSDPTVRVVLLCTVFFADLNGIPANLNTVTSDSSAVSAYITSCHNEFCSMSLAPLTVRDLFSVLTNKFCPEKFGGILEYGKEKLDMSKQDREQLIRDVTVASLRIGCKGKILKKLVEADDSLADVIAAHVWSNYRIDIDDLPTAENGEAGRYEAPLCRNYICHKRPESNPPVQPTQPPSISANETEQVASTQIESRPDPDAKDQAEDSCIESAGVEDMEELGAISQDTLSEMIQKDDLTPARRRRYHEMYPPFTDSSRVLNYPSDHLPVGKWIRQHYGRWSAVTAVFAMHAMVNTNLLVFNTPGHESGTRVPITLKHFKLLARLGRAPYPSVISEIESGTEFYFSEEDYLSPEETRRGLPGSTRTRRPRIKNETIPRADLRDAVVLPVVFSRNRLEDSGRGRKRPRRSTAANVVSYVVPDSDDEVIAEGKMDASVEKRRSETNLQRWIKHLTILHREEQKKSKEKRKREVAAAAPGAKVRVSKTEFLKFMGPALAKLRKIDRAKRKELYGDDVPSEDYSEGEEDEYQYRTTRSKRRRVSA